MERVVNPRMVPQSIPYLAYTIIHHTLMPIAPTMRTIIGNRRQSMVDDGICEAGYRLWYGRLFIGKSALEDTTLTTHGEEVAQKERNKSTNVNYLTNRCPTQCMIQQIHRITVGVQTTQDLHILQRNRDLTEE
ncbi:hypothetical protein H5410_037628 [Solanum commersonii]|uniref:Uncharacterized protein n=1 Tax=Solanum commersonii TaxID=4109 RepID=A0A9J5YAR6_SOLCO|nr:hypothetical protein H5410_037628 [Solanum commersonii]